MMTRSIIQHVTQQVKEHPARKSQGIHYTPPELARFLSSQMVAAYHNQPRGRPPCILDPAVGDGELLVALTNDLRDTGCGAARIYGFDTDEKAIEKASQRLRGLGVPADDILLQRGDFVKFALEYGNPSSPPELFEKSGLLFDLIIANPPYVRTQVMGSTRAQELTRLFELSGRVDLYYAFVLAIARVLQPRGYAAVIVSNRFMTTKSGADVRSGILKLFEVLHVWDLGDTKLFEAAVLPALMLLRKRSSATVSTARFTAIYEEHAEEALCASNSILEAIDHEGVVSVDGKGAYRVRQGLLDHSETADGIWRIKTEKNQKHIQSVTENTALTFGKLGKIRVGVKTCADSIFIRRDWDTFPADLRPELLWPLTTHKIARRFKPAVERDKAQILYPHVIGTSGRAAVDLELYPNSAAYLEKHRGALEKRRYLIESGRSWYEIWVPQDPGLWKEPKLVFRDIASEPAFWIDNNGSIVNGDCYWLHPYDDRKELIWLAAAVGNSSFVEWFYDVMFNNKLYAGRRRFMTQYVEQFPLPAPERQISKKIMSLAKQAYDVIGKADSSAIEKEIDNLVWQAFGLDQKEVAR